MVYLLTNLEVCTEAQMPTHILFTFTELDDPIFSSQSGLTFFDREIFYAVLSLYHSGHQYINSQMIFNLLTGSLHSQDFYSQIGSSSSDNILQSIIRLSRAKHTSSPNILPCWIMVAAFINKKHLHSCFYITDTPFLYDTTMRTKQFVLVEANLLNTSDNCKSTHNLNSRTTINILLKGYLLRTIAIAKASQDTKHSIRIAYQTIFSYLGIPQRDDSTTQKEYDVIRRKHTEARAKTKEYLSFLKQRKFIRQFDDYVKSINITF